MRFRTSLFVFTHLLALAIGLTPYVSLRYMAPEMRRLQSMLAESYSTELAHLEVRVGDDAAAVAGLRRHLSRLTTIRDPPAAAGAGANDVGGLESSVCETLSEIAALTPASAAAERDAVVAEVLASCFQYDPHRNAQLVLRLGATWLRRDRQPE